MIDDPTLVVICILSGWLVFLFWFLALFIEQPSEGSGLLSFIDALGELIATILILQ